MTEKENKEEELWATTTWAGNKDAHLNQVLASSYEARFLWVCEAFEFMEALLPSRYDNP